MIRLDCLFTRHSIASSCWFRAESSTDTNQTLSGYIFFFQSSQRVRVKEFTRACRWARWPSSPPAGRWPNWTWAGSDRDLDRGRSRCCWPPAPWCLWRWPTWWAATSSGSKEFWRASWSSLRSRPRPRLAEPSPPLEHRKERRLASCGRILRSMKRLTSQLLN